MAYTITGITNGVTLGAAAPNAVTVVGTLVAQTIDVAVVLGSAAYPNRTVTNNGTVFGDLFEDNGIVLQGSGTVVNGSLIEPSAKIIAYYYGVIIGAMNPAAVPGLVVNYGSIISMTAAPTTVELGAGGTLVNAAGGLISDGGGQCSVYVSADAGTINNSGTLAGGVYLAAGGSLTNAVGGTIFAYENAVFTTQAASVVNAGTIRGGDYSAFQNGVDLSSGGSLINLHGGLIEGFNAISLGGTLTNVTGSASNAGTLIGQVGAGVILTAGGAITNVAGGRISAAGDGVQVVGTSTATYGLITNAGAISGTIGVDFSGFSGSGGETVVNTGSIGSSKGAAGDAILFTAGPDRLEVGQGSTLIGAVAGLTGGNTIQFDGVAAATALFDDDLLILKSSSGTVVASLDLVGAFTATQSLVSTNGTATLLTLQMQAPCFTWGTRIATPRGEVPIEALRIGDEVTTLAGPRGIRWIGRRSYNGRFIAGNPDILPITIRRGALANWVPCRDLTVSPKHALFLRDMLVPAERLVNGASIIQHQAVERLDYLHLEFADHVIIFAEGAASESFVDCDSRLLFQNAHEFEILYPGMRRRRATECAPRVEHGTALHRVRRLFALRAGLTAMHADDAPTHGWLDGRVDQFDHEQISGWAFDSTRPHTPVWLEIVDNGRVVGDVLADMYRPDLTAAGKGSGRCSYIFRFRRPLSPAISHDILVRRRADHALLPGTPVRRASVSDDPSTSASQR
jgi:hypothetical protein